MQGRGSAVLSDLFVRGIDWSWADHFRKWRSRWPLLASQPRLGRALVHAAEWGFFMTDQTRVSDRLAWARLLGFCVIVWLALDGIAYEAGRQVAMYVSLSVAIWAAGVLMGLEQSNEKN